MLIVSAINQAYNGGCLSLIIIICKIGNRRIICPPTSTRRVASGAWESFRSYAKFEAAALERFKTAHQGTNYRIIEPPHEQYSQLWKFIISVNFIKFAFVARLSKPRGSSIIRSFFTNDAECWMLIGRCRYRYHMWAAWSILIMVLMVLALASYI